MPGLLSDALRRAEEKRRQGPRPPPQTLDSLLGASDSSNVLVDASALGPDASSPVGLKALYAKRGRVDPAPASTSLRDAFAKRKALLDILPCAVDVATEALPLDPAVGISHIVPVPKRGPGRPRKIAKAESAIVPVQDAETHTFGVLDIVPMSVAAAELVLANSRDSNKFMARSHGILIPSALRLVPFAAHSLYNNGHSTDAEAKQVADDFLREQYHNESMLSRSARLNVDRRKCSRTLLTTAAVAELQDRSYRATVEEALVASLPSDDLSTYIDCVMYDEAVFKLGEADQSKHSTDEQVPDERPASSGETHAMVVYTGHSNNLSFTVKSPVAAATKILATMSKAMYLVRISGIFYNVIYPSISRLQVIERCTAECIKEAQIRVSGATHCSLRFKARSRTVGADEHPSNIKGERGIMNDRKSSSLLTGCDVHVTARIHSKTFLHFKTRFGAWFKRRDLWIQGMLFLFGAKLCSKRSLQQLSSSLGSPAKKHWLTRTGFSIYVWPTPAIFSRDAFFLRYCRTEIGESRMPLRYT